LTAFLVTDEARELIAAGRSTQRFTLSNGHFVVKPDLPEAAVGYEERYCWTSCARMAEGGSGEIRLVVRAQKLL
jgi:hypothetical protein